MSIKADFGCLPTAIGSMPHTDATEACREVVAHLSQVPAWPQLPSRSPLESLHFQFSSGFPGATIEGKHIFVDRSCEFDGLLEKLYDSYLRRDLESYPTETEYASGLHTILSWDGLTPAVMKGQIIGPITMGLGTIERDQRPILYDDVLADALAKFLHLKAAWQERTLCEISTNTIVFVDEPSMSYLGSAFVSLPRERVETLLNEVFGGISGIKGIHCCGNTDWSMVLGAKTDIVSFDAYEHAKHFSLYPEEVSALIARGGAIAWGIVPNTIKALEKETLGSLRDRLGEAMAPFTRKGIRYRQLLEQSLLTPACGLAGLSTEAASHALELLTQLAQDIRNKYTL